MFVSDRADSGSMRRVLRAWRAIAPAIAATGLMMLASPQVAAENFKSVGGLAIYLGVLPAPMVQGHPTEHPEPKMHGGVPSRRGQQHVVVAVFDAASSARIEDAVVTAKVSEPGLTHVEKRLEPMPIAGAMSYGNYFAMPAKSPYRIDLRIVRPATGKTVDATFTVTPSR